MLLKIFYHRHLYIFRDTTLIEIFKVTRDIFTSLSKVVSNNLLQLDEEKERWRKESDKKNFSFLEFQDGNQDILSREDRIAKRKI